MFVIQWIGACVRKAQNEEKEHSERLSQNFLISKKKKKIQQR
jgi:hypothetical protein